MKRRAFRIRDSYVSPVIWGWSLCVMLLISGIHTGLVALTLRTSFSGAATSTIVVFYWIVVSLLFTILIRRQMKRAFDAPVKQIAQFVGKVAQGDFSQYMPPRHTADRYDYMDTLILDLNKMVEDLGSIETLKTDFFSNVSHEIKTPLAVIQNTAELLQQTDMPEEERQKHVQTILSASRRLSSLITNILKLNKLEKQAITLQMEAYDLCAQLCDCALQFESVWEKKDIEFDAEVDDRVMIQADSSLMELVWTNLLSNAFKFTPPGGTVRLVQTIEEEYVAVMVEDTGCGMGEQTMRHIFDKFYQGDTSHSSEGNGLGLALVHRALLMMDCTIDVQSSPGRGSAFTVRIPLSSQTKEQDQ